MYLTLIVPLFFLPAVPHDDTVRVGLLSLFKPAEVILSAVDGSDVSLTVKGDTTARFRLTRGAEVILRLRSGGVIGVSGLTDQPVSLEGRRIELQGPARIRLKVPGKITRLVRGELCFSASPELGGAIRIVLIAGRESVVASVVAAETGGVDAKEALKTMAVIARTYMAAQETRHAGEGFDFCDTTHCQFYRGEEWADNPAGQLTAIAVDETRGLCLWSSDAMLDGYYTAACGGLTVTPGMIWGGAGRTSYVYRRIFCSWCRDGAYWRWTRAAGAEAVLASLADAVGFHPSPRAALETQSDKATGFVWAVVLRDGTRKSVMTADAFRRAVGMKLGWNTVRSPTFTVQRRGPRFVFQGKGFGSQVGLCVSGAIAQARKGRTYSQILSYYFPGSRIARHR
jgi:stage II sporulation protein D